jgi:hypothetical protein
MKDSKALLIRDTLSFFRQEGLVSSPPKFPPQPPNPKRPLEKKAVPLPRKGTPPLSPKVEKLPPLAKEKPKVESVPLLIDVINQQLPHIKIIEEIPRMLQALILCEIEEDFHFYERLRRAIDQQLCPCTISRGGTVDFSLYMCVITLKDQGLSYQILVERAQVYQKHPGKKRILWAQICKTLSRKSS